MIQLPSGVKRNSPREQSCGKWRKPVWWSGVPVGVKEVEVGIGDVEDKAGVGGHALAQDAEHVDGVAVLDGVDALEEVGDEAVDGLEGVTGGVGSGRTVSTLRRLSLVAGRGRSGRAASISAWAARSVSSRARRASMRASRASLSVLVWRRMASLWRKRMVARRRNSSSLTV